jgi:NitT/TauT family transport system permease protein
VSISGPTTVSAKPAPPARRLDLRARASSALNSRPVLFAASLVVILSIWQLAGTGHPYTITTPSAVWNAATNDMTSLVLPAFGTTLKAFGIGFALCVAVGIPVGLLMGQSRLVELALAPYISALYATPRVALIPIVMLWAGLAFGLQLVVAFLFGVFPIILNVYIGVKEVQREYIDVGTAFAAGRGRVLWTIIIPGSLHYIFAGMRIGLGYAMIGTVVAELEASVQGIGNLMHVFGQELKIADVWVPLILLGVFSVCCWNLLNWAERWASMPWTRRARRTRWPS